VTNVNQDLALLSQTKTSLRQEDLPMGTTTVSQQSLSHSTPEEGKRKD